ncbi:MAG: tryptophan-rich sensory protein [Gemmatimonadetes bacterium]|nr:tryptophan-rich sensory protein [Gemmatimonadota bacterium]
MDASPNNQAFVATRGSARWVGNVVAFGLVILVNWQANALPIGGQTTGDVSAKYSSLFTPADYTFSIWGLIYLSLAGFVIFQALPNQRQDGLLAGIDRAFVLNCCANIAWIYAWHHDQLVLSLVVMAVILRSLLKIYRTILSARELRPVSWIVRLPFSLYTAWITLATIANISVVQTAMGWDEAFLNGFQWAYLKLAISGLIATLALIRGSDVVFALVISWAALGIASKQAGVEEVAGAASLLAILIFLIAVWKAVRLRRQREVGRTSCLPEA